MKIFRKDIIIIIIILALASGIYWFNIKHSNTGDFVQVTVDGIVFGEYPLNKDGIYEIDNGTKYNIIEIKDKKVKVSDASCKNQICVEHGAISRDNESIICIPNKVVVKIINSKKNSVDDIAR